MKRVFLTLLLSSLLLIGLSAEVHADSPEKPFEFTTVTLEGKEIGSRELFGDNSITVVNIWATWCKPCIEELDELNELHARLQKQGCGVVGVLWDGDTALEEGQAIAEEKKLSYPNVLLCEDMDGLSEIRVFPTTLFVDSEGRPVAEAITGARMEQVEKTVLALLNKKASAAGPAVYAGGGSDGGGNGTKKQPGKTDGHPAGTQIPEGMKLVCDGDSCTLVPADVPGTPDSVQPAPEQDPQPEPAETYPSCPVILVHVSDTEVHFQAAGEYAGMDGSAPYDEGNGGEE